MVLRADSGIWITGTGGLATYDATKLINTSSGAYLTTGGVWTDLSDRNKKENFASVDAPALLEKVAALPITQWNYKVDNPKIKHIGPTAQDFYAIFGLGNDDKSTAAMDKAGIALAAIQGLYKMLEEQKTENEELRDELKELRELMQKLLTGDKEKIVYPANLNR